MCSGAQAAVADEGAGEAPAEALAGASPASSTQTRATQRRATTTATCGNGCPSAASGTASPARASRPYGDSGGTLDHRTDRGLARRLAPTPPPPRTQGRALSCLHDCCSFCPSWSVNRRTRIGSATTPATVGLDVTAHRTATTTNPANHPGQSTRRAVRADALRDPAGAAGGVGDREHPHRAARRDLQGGCRGGRCTCRTTRHPSPPPARRHRHSAARKRGRGGAGRDVRPRRVNSSDACSTAEPMPCP